MKTKYIFLLGLVVAFSSCSTAYKSGQTPDDVYYSPAPPQDTYVRTDNQDERESYSYNNTTNREDLQIRRGIRDSRYRDNNAIVEFGYGGYAPYSYDPYSFNSYGYNPYAYNSYGYGHGYGYNSLYYNPYNIYNNSLYVSPYNNYYYAPQVYVYPSHGSVRGPVAPRRYNLGAYDNRVTTIRNQNNSDRVNPNSAPVRTFSTRSQNNGTGAGNLIRRVFTPDNNNSSTRSFNNNNSNNNNNYNNTNSTPVRSTPPPSNNSSSSGSSSAPVRTFKR